MLQQIFAILIVGFFLFRLFWQKQKKSISAWEFWFWLVFWVFAFLAILYLKKLDKFFANLGFSASAIQVLSYFVIIILLYFVFRLRLRIEKIEQNLTKIIREISLIKK